MCEEIRLCFYWCHTIDRASNLQLTIPFLVISLVMYLSIILSLYNKDTHLIKEGSAKVPN